MKDYRDINNVNLKHYLENFGGHQNIKVLFFSLYKPDYTRTETIEQLFHELSIPVIKNNEFKKNYFLRLIYTLIWLIKNIKKCDVVYVHFRGHEILPVVKLVSFLFRKPIIFDMFISMWDTICFDRKIIKPNSLLGKFIKRYDKFLIQISDFILVDTQTHLNYFINTLGLSKEKGGFLYVGANEMIFHPMQVVKSKKFRIFWYGSVLPLQGIDIILKAAKLLENSKDIEFVLVGPIKKFYGKLIKELNIKNVSFIDWVPYKELPKEICKSHICLGGHFSKISKAKRVIAGKTFQFVSCGITTVIGDNQANGEIFNGDGTDNTYFVKMNDEKCLYNLILKTYNEKY